MNPQHWLAATGIRQTNPDGPALLLPEIAALLYGRVVWVPFAASNILATGWLGGDGKALLSNCTDGDAPLWLPAEPFEAVYFGVPTIVNDKALFGALRWNVREARKRARSVTQSAIETGATLIVSGLGSGDISPDDRIADMGGGEVVAYKKFDGFEDWVIARWL